MARLKTTLLILGLAGNLWAGSGCVKPRPQPFDIPIESRLILQAPFFGAEAQRGAAGALAEVMTYHGRPTDAGKIVLALGEKTPTPHALAVWARGEGAQVQLVHSNPSRLVESVRAARPVIVRLGAAAPPLSAGDYAVVVGYNPEGVVINSRSIHQQIVAWGPFLTGWLKTDNLTLEIAGEHE